VGVPSRLRLLGALLVFLAVSGWPASAAAPPARRLVAREFVAVADLDPDIVVDLNVVSGHVRVSGDNLLDAPVAEIGDPRHGHRLFRYTGGIPGLTPVRGSADVGARTRGPGRLPVWGSARRARDGGGFLIVFPDGRRVRVRTDHTGRAVSIGWPGNGGGTLTASVRYTNALTTVSDPFGISRVYRHDRAGHASRVVPASWRGPGYRHPLVDVLDNPRETGWLQYRSADYTDRIARAARNDLAYERPADGGILEVALASLRQARRLDSLLGRLGLLDMTQVQSALLNQRQSQAGGPRRPGGASTRPDPQGLSSQLRGRWRRPRRNRLKHDHASGARYRPPDAGPCSGVDPDPPRRSLSLRRRPDG